MLCIYRWMYCIVQCRLLTDTDHAKPVMDALFGADVDQSLTMKHTLTFIQSTPSMSTTTSTHKAVTKVKTNDLATVTTSITAATETGGEANRLRAAL
jgi:hypothetical protein